MTSRLRELIQQLGEAIHESVIESEQIAGVVQDIRKHGFDVLLMLEATIGLNEVSKDGEAAEGAVGRRRLHVHQERRELPPLPPYLRRRRGRGRRLSGQPLSICEARKAFFLKEKAIVAGPEVAATLCSAVFFPVQKKNLHDIVAPDNSTPRFCVVEYKQ